MKDSCFTIPNAVLFAEVEERLSRGESVTIPFAGVSMKPFLHDREDKITLSPLTRDPQRGDVLLFRCLGLHILHRVVDCEGDRLTMQGDNCLSRERIERHDVVGILTSVQRKSGRVMTAGTLRWRAESCCSVIRREVHRLMRLLFNRKMRKRLSPVYFVVLLLLMWLPMGFMGLPLNNFVFGIRLDHLLHASVYVPCAVYLMDVPRVKMWGVWLMAVMVALTTETVQYFLPYRGFDINDLVANIMGVTLGWLVVRHYRKSVAR